MEELILKRILKSLENGQKTALVTVTEVGGSTPRDAGSLMLVWENGETFGSIGGGKIEYYVIDEALEALKTETEKMFEHSLTPKGDLEMQCGGMAKGFIKIFKPKNKIIIAGGGHVGEKVLELANFLGFRCEVVDDREEYADKESLKLADELVIKSFDKALDEMNVDENTYIVITTKSHVTDIVFVKKAIKTKAKYIGLIGSRTKQIFVRETLAKDGFTDEEIKKIYGPMGIDIANQMPEEIAVSILSEILLVKNNASLEHRKLDDELVESIIKKNR